MKPKVGDRLRLIAAADTYQHLVGLEGTLYGIVTHPAVVYLVELDRPVLIEKGRAMNHVQGPASYWEIVS